MDVADFAYNNRYLYKYNNYHERFILILSFTEVLKRPSQKPEQPLFFVVLRLKHEPLKGEGRTRRF